VGHFVQKDLVHLVIFGSCRQIFGDSDSSFGVVALPKTGFCVIETKAP
jgi:hypothetical protein